MIIGISKEIKADEFRVGLNPQAVREVVAHDHRVLVETGAGLGIGQEDAAYRAVGAEIAADAEEVFARCEMIVKVKEPQATEYERLRENQILFTYLHLAADPRQVQALMKQGCIALAYETVTSPRGTLPLLMPMSEIAGCMASQVGACHLHTYGQGRGILLGGVAGVAAGKVVVLGGGVAGSNAARIAVGMGADVTIIDRDVERLRYLSDLFDGRVETLFSTEHQVAEAVAGADLVIGTVLIPGANAPKLITRDLLGAMKNGSVIVDVAIDQGGCCESSRATTHHDPVYLVDGVVHYCVANMPGAVAKTATDALNNVILPYVLVIADKGVQQALADDPHLRRGLAACRGRLCCHAVAAAQSLPYTDANEALRAL